MFQLSLGSMASICVAYWVARKDQHFNNRSPSIFLLLLNMMLGGELWAIQNSDLRAHINKQTQTSKNQRQQPNIASFIFGSHYIGLHLSVLLIFNASLQMWVCLMLLTIMPVTCIPLRNWDVLKSMEIRRKKKRF